ncbi:uncharacterized protein LOC144433821 isoform X2 [Glandiceps talaboti]
MGSKQRNKTQPKKTNIVKEHSNKPKDSTSQLKDVDHGMSAKSNQSRVTLTLFTCIVLAGGVVWKVLEQDTNRDEEQTSMNKTTVVIELDESLADKLDYYGVTYSLQHIDRRHNLSLQEYLDVYDAKWPVLVTDVVPTWPAFNWTKEFFAKNYGDVRVAMKGVEGKLTKAESLAVPLKLFAEHAHEGKPKMWTYLEDELFIPQHPELRKDIGEAIYLKEDFFELFPSEVQPWNAMLLWGTAYSRSSLHIDPYNWTGTNAVLKGIKRWKLYPPGQDEYLYVFEDQKSGFPLDCYKYNSPIDTHDVDWKKYPKFKDARAIEFDQYPGEILLIPTGWFHQAFNVKETMAISSQVMNTNNYRILLEEILKADNLGDQELPDDLDTLSPRQQACTCPDCNVYAI